MMILTNLLRITNPGCGVFRSMVLNRSISHIRHNSTECKDDGVSLKTEVINLYKNLIYLSRDWHHDLRPQIKEAFMKNRSVTDPEEIRKLIDKGEYISREIMATYRLKKYRAMKRRYYLEESDKLLDDISRILNQPNS